MHIFALNLEFEMAKYSSQSARMRLLYLCDIYSKFLLDRKSSLKEAGRVLFLHIRTEGTLLVEC